MKEHFRKFQNIVLQTWGDGVYLDRWMIVHLVGGVAVGVFLDSVGIPVIVSVVVMATLLILWEAYELRVGFIEPQINKIFDVIVGVVGLMLGYLIPSISFLWDLGLALLLLLVWGGLTVVGWRQWRQHIQASEKE